AFAEKECIEGAVANRSADLHAGAAAGHDDRIEALNEERKMSGLCGWMGFGGDTPALIDAMAQPMARFDGSVVQALHAPRSAVAVSAAPGGAQVHQRDGLLVAVWGRPGVSDAVLAERAAAQGLASTLAAVWLQGKPEVVAQILTGGFSVAILDERSG